jgi:hypothetical protein
VQIAPLGEGDDLLHERLEGLGLVDRRGDLPVLEQRLAAMFRRVAVRWAVVRPSLCRLIR